jgi:Tat protein translocase TatB subunit
MNLGLPEMVFIFLLALVVVGPKRLPGLARQVGKWVAEFKRASNDFRNQLETEMMNIELDEHARKQTESPDASPSETVEKSWQPTMLPPVGIVNRSNDDATTKAEIDSTSERPIPSSMSQPPTPVRSGPDA